MTNPTHSAGAIRNGNVFGMGWGTLGPTPPAVIKVTVCVDFATICFVVVVVVVAVPPLPDHANESEIIILAQPFTVRCVGTFQPALATIVVSQLTTILHTSLMSLFYCKSQSRCKRNPYIMFA